MRRMALFSFALLPALAYGQASTAAATQTTPASNLQARVNTPPALAAVAASAAAPSRPVKTIVTLKADPQDNHAALQQGGALSYTLVQGDTGNVSAAATSAVLTHVVGVDVANITAPAADVTVHMTVDPRGIPTNLKIERSAGAELDSKTLAAVSQYRFKPATYDRRPIESDVTVDVKLQK